jgi:hypothetical protein
MSPPFHLHFLVHGPWSFTWEGEDPEMPGTAIADVFKHAGTFISVDLADGISETRPIPCRIEPGEIARVYSQVVPEQFKGTRASRVEALIA